MNAYLNRIKTIDFLIRQKATGTPEVFSRRLGISRRTLFETLQFMKEQLDAPIVYNKYRETYTYSENGFLYLTFKKTV